MRACWKQEYAMAAYGYALVMIPAGVPIPRAYYQDYDHSDIHRDRLYGTQSAFNNIDQEDVYYRSTANEH